MKFFTVIVFEACMALLTYFPGHVGCKLLHACVGNGIAVPKSFTEECHCISWRNLLLKTGSPPKRKYIPNNSFIIST
jgi:hypothetical protein